MDHRSASVYHCLTLSVNSMDHFWARVAVYTSGGSDPTCRLSWAVLPCLLSLRFIDECDLFGSRLRISGRNLGWSLSHIWAPRHWQGKDPLSRIIRPQVALIEH